MKITVRNLKNEQVKELDLPESVFGVPFKEHLVHLAVEAIRAAARAGTHKTKTRAEVSGAGKKLWRQKGTGRARMGSLRSPLWRKGGTVHGPQPRDYTTSMSPRDKKNALKCVLTKRLAEERILVIDSLDLGSHKTKDLANQLGLLGIAGKALLVDRHDNLNLLRASRNIPTLKTVDAMGVNVYDVVARPFLVLSEGALVRLVEVLDR